MLYLLARNIELNLGAKILNSSQLQNLEFCDLNSSTDVDASDKTGLNEEAPILRRIKRQLSLKSGKLHEDEEAEFSEFCESSLSGDRDEDEFNDLTDESHCDTIGDFSDMRLSETHWTEAQCNVSVLKDRKDVMLAQLDWENPDEAVMEKLILETDVVIAAGLFIIRINLNFIDFIKI